MNLYLWDDFNNPLSKRKPHLPRKQERDEDKKAGLELKLRVGLGSKTSVETGLQSKARSSFYAHAGGAAGVNSTGEPPQKGQNDVSRAS
ncbi:hypothetical protein EVAR_78237_1 [Eumeta japonica]|uniref:Uncharacterized protein n=1 Tax=Eumeta variegata TaxID=151549 RepID=A0A4C1T3X5_EUMVA|nr:hypothetical protein EVAR_78237_1 [Eumeta japonica]